MKNIKNIIRKIEKHNKIALFTHINPDGDSLSSSYGLALALKQKYPKKTIKVVSNFEYLNDNFPFMKLTKSFFTEKIDNTWLTIVGDTSIKERIWYYEEYEKGKEKICFDHHQSKINFDADIFWSEPDYPASSLQAAEIAFALGIKLKEKTSIGLLLGILTDTGFFRFSTNNPKPPYIYSKLIESTTDKSMNALFGGMSIKTKKDITLTSYIYENVKYKKNLSYLVVPNSLVKKYGYTAIKMKVNIIANIEGNSVWAFFIEKKDNKEFPWKISLRTQDKNVNAIAIMHHGGGHIKASGCQAKDIKEVNKIINKLSKL